MNFVDNGGGCVVLELSGNWLLGCALPLIDDVEHGLKREGAVKRLEFDTTAIKEWDTALLTFLVKVNNLCAEKSIETIKAGLPEGAGRLLALAVSSSGNKAGHEGSGRPSFFARVGSWAIGYASGSVDTLAFFGEVAMGFGNLARGRTRFRWNDLMREIQDCGAQALPIVTLITFLVGLILAFMGSLQLEMFGAEIYVADLVGLGMTREMGTMMVAMIMAGRTGAAFAAQLGTMHVNDEIDALRTFGISPVDALVLPRMIALILMMPLLCIYGDICGIVGGAIVGVAALDISLLQYVEQTRTSVGLNDFAAGIIKSVVFGAIVAICGCLKGMRCGKSSEDVGKSTTSAVVTGIVFVIVLDAILTIIYEIINL